MKSTVLIWSVFLVAIIGVCFLISMVPEPPPLSPLLKYTVKINNWVGKETYQCERYERDGISWILYGASGNVVAEITATDGYAVRATLNNR